jgi:hypothetical protein
LEKAKYTKGISLLKVGEENYFVLILSTVAFLDFGQKSQIRI